MTGVTEGGLLRRLRRYVVGAPTDRVLYECRRCGQTIQGPSRSCPGCGAADIAQYEL